MAMITRAHLCPVSPYDFIAAQPLALCMGGEMKQIGVGVIGTGWCGGIRAETAAGHPLVKTLHVAETRPERLREIAAKTGAKTATADYRELLRIDGIDAIMISATPESTHFPMARDALAAGKHVLLEKPIAIELAEADELIALARRNKLKFTIGYSQRFNPKYAYVKQCVRDGTIGKPVSALVSRHITRGLGKKITGRSKLSPAAMESTHDLDFVLWCLEPAKPARVYSQLAFGAMQAATGADIPDCQWITVTMDNGLAFVVGGGWSLPPGYPNFSSTWIEFLGTEGALLIDDSHKDVVLNTMKSGMQLPMSTMPGEPVEHVYAGPMAAETVSFLEAVAYDRPVMVTPEHARMVMEVYMAADLSAERNAPVDLPLAGPAAKRAAA
jgi:predicted dehydrogenase